MSAPNPLTTLIESPDRLKALGTFAIIFNVPPTDSAELTCRLTFLALNRDILTSAQLASMKQNPLEVTKVVPQLRRLLAELSTESYI